MHKDEMPTGQHLIVTMPASALRRQADEALAAIEAANGGVMPATLRAAYDVDRAAFSSLIEALFNLGADVEPELVELAGLKPIEQVL